MWCVYILITTDAKYTYCGATNDFTRRFRQHCGLIKGGAKYTTNLVKSGFLWRPLVVLNGLQRQTEALQLELCQKAKMASYRKAQSTRNPKDFSACRHSRIKILAQSLALEKWTCHAVESATIPLDIYWYHDNDIPDGWKEMMPSHLKESCQLAWKESPFQEITRWCIPTMMDSTIDQKDKNADQN